MTDDASRPSTTSEQDWAARATSMVEGIVSLVRDHSLRPLLTIVRFAVLGLLALSLVLLVAVLGIIGLVRLLTEDAFGGRVWASDLLVGALVVLAGVGLWSLSQRVGRKERHA